MDGVSQALLRRDSNNFDLKAAVIAGLVASGVAMVLDLFWTVFVLDSNPWRTSYLVAAMVMGRDLLQGVSQGFGLEVVLIALAIHLGLGLLFGILIAGIIAGAQAESSRWRVVTIGAASGALLYFVNFYGMDALFPWIPELRSWIRGLEHVLFGIFAALEYRTLARPCFSPSAKKTALLSR